MSPHKLSILQVSLRKSVLPSCGLGSCPSCPSLCARLWGGEPAAVFPAAHPGRLSRDKPCSSDSGEGSPWPSEATGCWYSLCWVGGLVKAAAGTVVLGPEDHGGIYWLHSWPVGSGAIHLL